MNDLDFLRNKWKELTSKFTDDHKFIYQFFEIIENQYGTKNRYYHNLEHIKLMLLEVKKYENRIDDYDSVIFAIWFHDIIYDPLKRDNEERSAELAKEFLIKIKYEKNRIHKVQELIIRTKDHTIQKNNDNFDIKVFLDLDLLIMGMEREDYVKYAKRIRKEYAFVPDDIYKKERKNILKIYLNSHFIYKTKKFRDFLEKQARDNIKYEISNFL